MRGWLFVLTGCMFSGKTEELQRLLKRHRIAHRVFQLFKPDIDDRYEKDKVTTHDNISLDATVVSTSDPMVILSLVGDDTKVVGIDEAQFFSPAILEVCETLLQRGINVIVAGLKQDADDKPFGSMAALLTIADDADYLRAICEICGEEATKTRYIGDKSDKTGQVKIGGTKDYIAVCNEHC
jgi:thymidine kinase